MSKQTLTKEISKELARLNNAIDRKIIRGGSYREEANRHKALLAQLQKLRAEGGEEVTARRRSRPARSPIRRSLRAGSSGRVFSWGFAMA